MHCLKAKLLGCILALALASSAHAATLFVDKDSSCPGNGATGTPYCSIQNAFNVVNAGDTIRIRDSATPYDEGARLTRSGSSGSPIIIEPDTGHNPTLRRTNLNALQGAIEVYNASHITIQNLTFDNAGVTNSSLNALLVRVTSTNMSGIKILNNTFRNWGGPESVAGVLMAGGETRAALLIASGYWFSPPTLEIRGTVIQGNTFTNNRQSNIHLLYAPDTVIENNTITNATCGKDVDTSRNTMAIKAVGCDFTAGCNTNYIIRNNVIHDFQAMTSCGISQQGFDTVAGIWCDVGLHNGLVEGNLIYNIGLADTGQVGQIDNTGIYIEHNCKNWTVRNNIVHDTSHSGIKVRIANNTDPASKYYNNTIYNVGSNGFRVADGKTIIKNNIVHNAAISAITIFNNTAALHDINFNLYWDNAGGTKVGQWNAGTTNFATWKTNCACDANSLNVDPRLANASAGNFNLCTAVDVPDASCVGASPAIDAGANVGIAFNGSAPDLGAIESGGSATIPGALWHLDESGTTTTATESSGNGVHLSLCQGTTCPQQGPAWVSGSVNNASSFDGTDDYMEVAHSTFLDITGDMTFAAWVGTTSTAHQQILSKENTSSCGTPYSVEIVNSHYLYYHCGPGSDESIEFTDYTVPTSGVHHVAMRRILSTKTVELYIDGTLVDSGTWTGTPGPATNMVSVRLGKSHVTATPRWFVGTLDEVRLVNRVLSPSEIQAMVDEGGTPGTFTGVSTTHHQFYAPDRPEDDRALSAVDGEARLKVNGKLRVRFGIQNDTGASLAQGFYLQCVVDPTGDFDTEVGRFLLTSSCATNPVCIAADSEVPNNTDTTNLLTVPGGFTFTPGTFVSGSSIPPYPTRTLDDAEFLENEYSVRITGLTSGQEVCCAPVFGDSQVLFDAYAPATGACFNVTGGKQVHR